jgi:hypothetical protein
MENFKLTIISFLCFFSFLKAQPINAYNCRVYDQHLVLTSYSLMLNTVNELDTLIKNIKEKDLLKFYPALDLKYNILPDTCNCFISFKPTLNKFNVECRSKDSCIFSNSERKIIVKTKEINIKQTWPTLYNKWNYTQQQYYYAIKNPWIDTLSLYGYKGDEKARVITNITIVYNNGYKIDIDTSFAKKLTNPSLDFDTENPELLVNVYETPDKKFTYIYIPGLHPYIDFKDKNSLKDNSTALLLNYYTKIILDNHDNKIRCAVVLPPNVLYRYQVMGINAQTRSFLGF